MRDDLLVDSLALEPVIVRDVEAEAGSGKRSFFCGSGSAKILPLPHRLFDLVSNLAKKFCPFPNVDLSGEVAL